MHFLEVKRFRRASGTGVKDHKMALFQVTVNGDISGYYTTDTDQDARDAAAIEAGYLSEADFISRLDQKVELKAIEVEAWSAWIYGQHLPPVRFYVPVNVDVDVTAAGAKALGINVCIDLVVQREDSTALQSAP